MSAYPLPKGWCGMKHTIYFPKNERSFSAFLFCIPLLIGTLSGSVWYSGHSGTIPSWIHLYFAPQLCGDTVSDIFFRMLLTELLFTVTALLSGLSAVGQPVSLIQPLYLGFGIGVSAALEYSSGGIDSLPEVFFLLLPKAIMSAVIVYLSVREALRSSCNILRAAVSGDIPERPGLKLYFLRFGVLAALCIIAAAADSLLSYLFAGFV